MMSEDACLMRISGGISSMGVGLSRMMLEGVGVKIGVKGLSQIGGFQYPPTCVGTVPPGAALVAVRSEANTGYDNKN
jgi:hypothetical protein